MKQNHKTAILVIAAFATVCIVSLPLAYRSTSASRAWNTALNPLRRILFFQLYSGVRTAQGTLRQAESGGWGLTYTQPQTDPNGNVTAQGIHFRVPAHLANAVAAAKGKVANVTIAKEPDPEHFNCATYVLTSVSVPE